MLSIIKQIINGKSLLRAMLNCEIKGMPAYGTVIDLGSGNRRPSYYKYLDFKSNSRVFTVNIVSTSVPDVISDLEDKFPFKDGCTDTIIAFNLLEHIYRYGNFVRECRRVLKKNGRLYIFVPFLVRYHPDPQDYFRFTYEALNKIIVGSGFKVESIREVGRGPFTAACSQIDGILSFNIFTRMLFALLVITAAVGDWIVGLISTPEKQLRGYPLGYLAVCRK